MIKLVVMDVDGTLTNGKIYFSSSGVEYKSFDIKDGMGIMLSREKGIIFALITGRESTIVERRAKELDIKYVYQSVREKTKALKQIFNDTGINPSNTLYIGDDINDIECMRECEYSACPADAVKEVVEIAKYKATKKAGNGAVREILNFFIMEGNS